MYTKKPSRRRRARRTGGPDTVNKAVLMLMEASRRLGRILPWKGKGCRAAFVRQLQTENGGFSSAGFVEDQSSLGNLRYGLASMRWSGCGPVAAANALLALGCEASLPDVIGDLEKDGAVLFGLGGTSPYAVRDLLRRRGFRVRLSVREAEFDRMLRRGKVFILLFVFDRRRRLNLHYVCMVKKDGLFEVHNLDARGKAVRVGGSFDELLDALTGGKGRSVMLMDIF